MPPNPWVLRPAYAPDRLSLPAGEQAPRAVAAVGSIVYAAPSVSASPIVYRANTAVSPFVITNTSSPLSAPARAMVALNNLATPAVVVATDETPAKLYKLRQDNLVAIGATLTLAAGEGPVTRLVYDGTYIHALIGSSPGRLVAVDPAGTGSLIRSHALILNAGENAPRGLTYNAPTFHVFVGASNGAVVKVLLNPGVPSYTRVSSVTLSLTNASALEYGRGWDGYLYAAAGAAGGAGVTAVYQVNPTTMTVRRTVSTPYTPTNFQFSHMWFDETSIRPGRYLYALLAGSPGYVLQFDTGRDSVDEPDHGFRLARRYTLDYNYNVDADSQLAFVAGASVLYPDYLYFSQYVNPGVLVRFDTSRVGLVLRPRYGLDFSRDSREVLYAPLGAKEMRVRTMGVRGRAHSVSHVVELKTDFDGQYAQVHDDEATLAAMQPFAWLGDFAPDAYRVTQKVVISGVRCLWQGAPIDLVPEFSFNIRRIN